MATLAVDTPRVFETGHDDMIRELPVVASDIIYDGAAVGDNASGIARPLVAGDPFLGFAIEQCDNSDGAASAKKVRVKTRGIVKLTVTSVASAADVDEIVYASDDATFTLASTNNSAIGRVWQWISSTTCLVYFQAKGLQDQA